MSTLKNRVEFLSHASKKLIIKSMAHFIINQWIKDFREGWYIVHICTERFQKCF